MSERRDTRLRFEQWVKNPDCEANVVSAVAGISMAKVAEAEGLRPTMGQSPFAITRGRTFERVLLANDAERLREALEREGVLPAGSTGFLDLRTRMNSGPIPTLDEACERTIALLRQAADATTPAARAQLPTIVAGATLKIPGQPVMLPDGVVCLDVLTIHGIEEDGPLTLRVGEIKTYPDRGGYTSKNDLASARAQGGVYLHALSLVLKELDLEERLLVAPDGFLVLTRPGSNRPSVRAGERLALQARRARRGFERLRDAAKAITPFDSKDEELAVRLVREADIAYNQSCLSFCDRAAGCRKRAAEAQDGAILGDDVAQFLGTTPLDRAVALLRGAEPMNEAERDLARRYTEPSIGEAS